VSETRVTSRSPGVKRTVWVVIIALIVLLSASDWGEIKRRLAYGLTGSLEADGVTMSLPSDDPFMQYLLDHGTRDTEATLASMIRDRLRPGDTFVDVGANVGWFTLIAAKAVGPTGRVIAFEPEPRNFNLLRRNVEANGFRNVTLERKAVSDETGTIRLNLSSTNENHSIAVLADQRGFVEVDAVRLDDYLSRYDRAINFIKIDTEGAEGRILAGMKETLARPGLSLFIEFDPFLLKAAGTDPAGLLGSLRSAGFDVRRVDEQTRGLAAVDAGRSGNLFLTRAADKAR
jgi:FkbM family methyltransferase